MPKSAPASKQYQYERHRPEETVLYKIIQENLANSLESFTEETGSERNLNPICQLHESPVPIRYWLS